MPALPKQINHTTGKTSNQLTVFNEPSWGMHCSSYVKLAKKLSASRFDEIIILSAEYMVKASQNLEDEDVIEIHDDDGDNDDICAIIVDHASSSKEDTNCM